MMKVVIAGTNGLAIYLSRYLQQTFHSCILLTRSSNHPLATTHHIMTVDYHDENLLIYTLSGTDLVISMVTGDDQLLLIDSALKAGVTRFVPAEFDGIPEGRASYPELDRGRRLALMRLRDHVAEGMQYTIIITGLLYERLGPGGLVNVNMGNVQGANGAGDFLFDQQGTSAVLPLNDSRKPAMVCMTAMDDVARFIVAALELPSWPREFRLQGERMSVRDVIALVGEIRFSHQVESLEQSSASLRTRLQDVRSSQQRNQIQRLNILLAISEGSYDYTSANLNDAIQLQPTPLRAWLQRAWSLDF